MHPLCIFFVKINLIYQKELLHQHFFWLHCRQGPSPQGSSIQKKNRSLCSFYSPTKNILISITIQGVWHSRVELAGIEPASENSSITASPITVCILTFPYLSAYRQAIRFGSFINFLRCQSFHPRVYRSFDARILSCGEQRSDSCHIRQRTRNFRLRLYLIPCFIAVWSTNGFRNF